MLKRQGWIIPVAAFVVAVLAIAACGGGNDDESTPTPGITAVVVTSGAATTQGPRRTPTPSPSPTVTPLEACAPNPDPASASVLQVEAPAPEARVAVPVHVRGWVSPNGAATTAAPTSTPGDDDDETPAPTPVPTPRGVSLAVVDVNQKVVQINELPPLPREFRVPPPGLAILDDTRPFAADIVLNDVTEATPYCLWIYLDTTEEGRARRVVQVPVVILPRN